MINDGYSVLLLSRSNDYKIFGLNKKSKKIKFLTGDFLSVDKKINELRKFKPDILVHLAWEGLPDTGMEFSLKNLEGGLKIFQMATDVSVKHVIAVGTQWEYGTRKGTAREDDKLDPFNPLAAAKISLELLGREMAKTHNIKFSWLRLFSVYGPGQRPGALIPSVVRSLKDGNSPQIKALDARNDFVYVDDVARAVSCVIKNQKEQFGFYNVASGKLTGIREIVGRIYKKFGKRIGKNMKSHGASHVPGLQADISRIKCEIGWRPEIDIVNGVGMTVDYFKNL